MLKALLHRKLPRGIVGRDENDADDPAPIEPTRREDPLTATVFERLAYLPPRLTWNILCQAVKPLADGGPALPPDAPSGAPTYSFWPSLRPGADGGNAIRVEPDVLVTWDDSLLVIEANSPLKKTPLAMGLPSQRSQCRSALPTTGGGCHATFGRAIVPASS